MSEKYDTPDELNGEFEILKDGTIEYPGHMAFANKGGEYFHGCRVAQFANITDLNKFFLPGKKGHLKLVGELIPAHDGSIICVYTNKLSRDDLEDVEEFNREMHSFFEKKREDRNEQRRKEQEKELKAAEEQKRLAEVGRKYEARIAKIREMPPGKEQKEAMKELNSGVLKDE